MNERLQLAFGDESDSGRLRRREEVLLSLESARARRRRQRSGAWGLSTIDRSEVLLITQQGR